MALNRYQALVSALHTFCHLGSRQPSDGYCCAHHTHVHVWDSSETEEGKVLDECSDDVKLYDLYQLLLSFFMPMLFYAY